MVALARLVVVGFVVLTVIYLSLSLYSRSVRRDKLKRWWEEEGRPGDLDTYIDEGMRDYEHSLRRKLIWGVYVVPVSAVALIIYFINFH
ncbi:hypothetical protein [Roseovarius salis]|uniref:hypothetical protein n=1 Tax=Roseovarius salis TaxID=3376063 RepID=UPI0037C6211F